MTASDQGRAAVAMCAWCGLAICLGIVTRGGVVWHLECRRRRQHFVRAFAG
jgi:hypothetical protein